VSLSSMVFGKPDVVAGAAAIGETGVDEQCAMVLRHAGGALSLLSSAVQTNTLHEALIFGTEGRIRVHSPWWRPSSLTIHSGGKDERVDFPYEGNGYQFEATEAADCIAQGLSESPILPLEESISIMETLDTLRAQFGLIYPFEIQTAASNVSADPRISSL
jgi:dihydrodiol dehydrogenase / D-xylose 1-dehydrogenase (NADP)